MYLVLITLIFQFIHCFSALFSLEFIPPTECFISMIVFLIFSLFFEMFKHTRGHGSVICWFCFIYIYIPLCIPDHPSHIFCRFFSDCFINSILCAMTHQIMNFIDHLLMFSCGLYFWFVDTFWMEVLLFYLFPLWGGGEYACPYELFHVCPFLLSPSSWNSWPELGLVLRSRSSHPQRCS